MDGLLNEIKDIGKKYRFDSLEQQIAAAEDLLREKTVEVSVFGQFKTGKSSFINHMAGKQVLPTGVVPVTSVISKIIYGPEERVYIHFENERTREIELADLAAYVTESKNPGNEKQVASARIELPELKDFEGLSLIDTPGTGSIFLNNTQTANENIALASIALVCVSAERPLAALELDLIVSLINSSYRVICLLTKADLFSESQLDEIQSFMETSLEQKTGTKIPVYRFSIYDSNGEYRLKITDEILRPLLESVEDTAGLIFRHKVINMGNACLNYLEVALKTSQKTEEERAQLKAKIFDEKINLEFIRQELTLITTEAKSRTRESVYAVFDPYVAAVAEKLKQQFDLEFQSWEGNLYKLSRHFEQWLKTNIGEELLKIMDIEGPRFNAILSETSEKFSFYTRTLKGRIEDKVYAVLGTRITAQEWQPEFRPVKKPDITVYPAFDIPIDLLWFLFPMFLFRNVFKRFFRKQIARELDKNMHRTTSIITYLIHSEMDRNKDRILEQVFTELRTIETALTSEKRESAEYQVEIDNLNQKIKALNINYKPEPGN
ncbi:MAG: dynamin family protein [Bacteroidales bacterium]|nr:dynamin family protein [Bacteroidales bacterium]